MAVKRCPMCHQVSESSAWRCRCGYEFGQKVDQTLVLLRDQRTNARIILGILVAMDLVAVGALMFMVFLDGPILFPTLGFAGLFGATARVARKLSITRASLRQLEKRELPRPRCTRSSAPAGCAGSAWKLRLVFALCCRFRAEPSERG